MAGLCVFCCGLLSTGGSNLKSNLFLLINASIGVGYWGAKRTADLQLFYFRV